MCLHRLVTFLSRYKNVILKYYLLSLEHTRRHECTETWSLGGPSYITSSYEYCLSKRYSGVKFTLISHEIKTITLKYTWILWKHNIQTGNTFNRKWQPSVDCTFGYFGRNILIFFSDLSRRTRHLEFIHWIWQFGYHGDKQREDCLVRWRERCFQCFYAVHNHWKCKIFFFIIHHR